MSTTREKELLACLGTALQYPTDKLETHIETALGLTSKDAVKESLIGFLEARKDYTSERFSEVYTRTFDVAPRCIPYMSIHLFGEESFHRARLMVGLRTSLLEVGLDPAPELPDHFALVLRAAPLLPEEEWDELIDFIIRASMHAMVLSIENSDNPYSWLLRAVQLIVGEATAEDIDRLNIAKRNGEKCIPPGSQQSCGTGGC